MSDPSDFSAVHRAIGFCYDRVRRRYDADPTLTVGDKVFLALELARGALESAGLEVHGTAAWATFLHDGGRVKEVIHALSTPRGPVGIEGAVGWNAIAQSLNNEHGYARQGFVEEKEQPRFNDTMDREEQTRFKARVFLPKFKRLLRELGPLTLHDIDAQLIDDATQKGKTSSLRTRL